MTAQTQPTARPVPTFMPFMFPPMPAPYPPQQQMMAGQSMGQMNDNVMSLI